MNGNWSEKPAGREGRNTGHMAPIVPIAAAVLATLVFAHGILLLCETDPAQFYHTLFGRILQLFQ